MTQSLPIVILIFVNFQLNIIRVVGSSTTGQGIGRCVQGPVYKGGEGQEMKIIFLKVDHILAFILFALYPSIIASFF